MSAGTHEAGPASTYTPTLGSLLSAELMRLRSRRFVRVLLVVFVIGVVLSAIGLFQSTGSGDSGAGASPQSAIDHSLAVGVGFVLVAFLIGCTAGGAEWSQKTMPALLFWEPRRVRVLLVKTLALVITVVVLLIAALAVWWAWEAFVIGQHGSWSNRSSDYWSVVIGTQIRIVVLAVIAVVGAFGLANLTRNTGAALGIAFVYFAIVETVVGYLRPVLQPFLLNNNIGGLLARGGLDVPTTRDGYDGVNDNNLVHLGAGRGALTLAVYAAVILGTAVVLFRRRDVT
jgi:hypothetical protein